MAVSNFIPIFLVEIAGRRLSGIAKTRVTAFSLDEREKQASEFKLTLTPQTGERLADITPEVGATIRVRWGYVGALEDTGEMTIHAVEPSYGAQQKVVVTARDHGAKLGHAGGMQVWENTELGAVVVDLARRAGLKAVLPRRDGPGVAGPGAGSTLFVSKSQAQATPQILLQRAAVPNAPREAAILREKVNLAQKGRSPRQLLQDIAAHAGCELHVQGKEMRLTPKHYAAAPRVVLRWGHAGSGLLEFTPKHHKGGKHEAGARGVVAAGIDRNTGKHFAVRADDASERGRPVLGRENLAGGDKGEGRAPGMGLVLTDSRSGKEVRLTQQQVDAVRGATTDSARRATATARRLISEFNPGLLAVSDQAAAFAGVFLPTPSGKPSDAKARAGSKHREAEGGGVTSSFRTLGDPRIRKGRIVEVRGLGPDRDGLYIVVSCSHPIGDGYETSGEVRRHGANRVRSGKSRTGGQPNAAAGPSQGQPGDKKSQVFYEVDSRKGGKVVGSVLR